MLKSQLSVEAHRFAATAYLKGPLTASLAARTIMVCRALPATVRGMRVDLRAMTMWDSTALTMLESHMVEWSEERGGVSRVLYPRSSARDAFVAVPCTIRDAPEGE
jgi:hypothetical protein